MLESGSSGSVRGVPSNGHPYRDPPPEWDASAVAAQWPDWGHEEPSPSRRLIGLKGPERPVSLQPTQRDILHNHFRIGGDFLVN